MPVLFFLHQPVKAWTFFFCIGIFYFIFIPRVWIIRFYFVVRRCCYSASSPMIGGDRCFPIRCVQCCALVSAACNTMSFSLSLGLDSLYQTMRLYVKHVCSCLCIQRSASFQYSVMPHGSLLDNRIERGKYWCGSPRINLCGYVVSYTLLHLCRCFSISLWFACQ